MSKDIDWTETIDSFDALARLVREAYLILKPDVPFVKSVGKSDDWPYIVVEFNEKHPLDDYIAKAKAREIGHMMAQSPSIMFEACRRGKCYYDGKKDVDTYNFGGDKYDLREYSEEFREAWFQVHAMFSKGG